MSERIFALLLALFPRAFRTRFGDELLAAARSADLNRKGRMHWMMAPRVVLDAITSALLLHRDMSRETRSPDNTSYTIRNGPVMNSLLRDLQYALRGLLRDHGFTLFVVGTLALGIGANAAMFGIADRLLVRGPEHVVESERVGRFYLTVEPPGMESFTGAWMGHVTYDVLRTKAKSFSSVAVFSAHDGVVGRGDVARPARIGYSSETLFPLLGVQPLAGRFFSAQENAEDAAQRVVVLGYGAWQRDFGGRADAIGKQAVINDESYTVIGVAPRGFTGPELGVIDYWAPANLRGPMTGPDWKTTWNSQWLMIVGRLAANVTPEAANAEVRVLHQQAYVGDDVATREGVMSFRPLRANNNGVMPIESSVVGWLGGVTLLVLLIACANVANLLLARGKRRQREIAIRAALGAGRRRLVTLLLIESLILSLAGAMVGLVLAWFLGGTARAMLFEAVDWSTSPVNGRVVVASTLLALLTGVIIGIIPALRASSSDLTAALKTGAREGHGRRTGLRGALTVTQASLSVLLLIGAGLFVRSLWNVRSLDLGLDANRLLLVSVMRTPLSRIPDGPQRLAERARRRQFERTALERLRSLSSVEGTAVAVGLPFHNRFSVTTRVPGRDSMPRLTTGGPGISAVTADYFATTGTRILSGRAFTATDRDGSEPVAIVSARMAQTVWPGESAIGKCLLVGDDPAPCHRIVGVAEDTRRGRLREDPFMHYYIPVGQERNFGGSVMLVRARGEARAIIPDVRRALLELDPAITYVRLESLQERIDPQMRPWKIGAAVFALSGLLALIVAAIGIYSVMSYLIADRRHEIGVRLALGAVAGDIVRLILRGSFVIAIGGIVAGELFALLLGRFLQPLLFDTSSRDPVVFGGVGVVLLMVALSATLIPAMRARKVDPMEALRSD